MRFNFKNKYAVTRDPNGLCMRCKNCMHATSNGMTLVRCRRFEVRLRKQVEECSEFEDKNAMSLYMMSNLAYFIEPSKAGKIGFASPAREMAPVKRYRIFDPSDYDED